MKVPALPQQHGWSNAVSFFRRPGPRNLFGLTVRSLWPVPAGQGELPAMECLWLPYYLVRMSTRFGDLRAVKDMAVDGWLGSAVITERGPDIQFREIGERDLLPARLSVEEAAECARKALFTLFLRGRAQLSRPTVEEVLETTLYYHPYWVLYRRMLFGGGTGIDLMDAYTGTACGGQVRHALLNALVQWHRSSAKNSGVG